MTRFAYRGPGKNRRTAHLSTQLNEKMFFFFNDYSAGAGVASPHRNEPAQDARPPSAKEGRADRAMNAGALITTVASSAASGAASEPGALLLAPGKGAAIGQVDAFTQALAALLGLPAQTTPQADLTGAAPNAQGVAATAQEPTAARAFAPLMAANAITAESGAAPQVATQSSTFILQPNVTLTSDRTRLTASLSQTIAAAAGAPRSDQGQSASLTAQANPSPAVQNPPLTQPTPSLTQAVDSGAPSANRSASFVLPPDSAPNAEQIPLADAIAAAGAAARPVLGPAGPLTAQANPPVTAQALPPQAQATPPAAPTADSGTQSALQTAPLVIRPNSAPNAGQALLADSTAAADATARPAQAQTAALTAQANPPADAPLPWLQPTPLATQAADSGTHSAPQTASFVVPPDRAPTADQTPLADFAAAADAAARPAQSQTAPLSAQANPPATAQAPLPLGGQRP